MLVELTRSSGTYDTVAMLLYSHCEALLTIPLNHVIVEGRTRGTIEFVNYDGVRYSNEVVTRQC